MSGCSDPRFDELLGAYALGSCGDAEAAELREHLRGCPSCTAALLELGAAREALLTAVPRRPAPPALKSRVMAQVRADAQLFAAARDRERPDGVREAPGRGDRTPRRAGWLARLRGGPGLAVAAACAALLLVGAGVLAGGVIGGDDGVGQPRTVLATVDPAQAPGARAELVVATDGGSRIVVDGLPSPGADRVYQVWLRTGDDPPRPAGALFAVDRDGSGEAAVPGTLGGVDEVLVSSEPAGGSQAPTRTPVLSAPV
jgi:anti-sigma factor RsiW